MNAAHLLVFDSAILKMNCEMRKQHKYSLQLHFHKLRQALLIHENELQRM